MPAASNVPFFVKEVDNSTDYWVMPETGKSESDALEGERAASDLIRIISFNQEYDLLIQIVKQIAEKGRFGTIEASFFKQISVYISDSM